MARPDPERDERIMHLTAQGLSASEIAAHLRIGVRTVERARARARGKHRDRSKEAPRGTVYCTLRGCDRRQAKLRTSGLCETHHREAHDDGDSPLVLTGGRWVRKGVIQVWEAA